MSRVRYNFFVGEQTLKSLHTVAKKDETTVSELIRRAIREYLHAMHRNAVVPWADKGAIAQFYALAVSLTASSMTRTTWHVDHIVPLRSELVCGLHTHNNLQVVTASANIRKSSKHWPDMP